MKTTTNEHVNEHPLSTGLTPMTPNVYSANYWNNRWEARGTNRHFENAVCWKKTYSCQFVDHALLLQDLKLEKGYFLVIVSLVQVIQRLQLLQWRMGADLLLLRTHKITTSTCPSNCPKKYKMNTWCQSDFVPTISRFSLTRLLSLSSSFWILWVKSSFLLLRSLFLSSRGLHCFSDSRTRFSWWGQIDTGMYRSATNTRQIYSERGKSYQFIPLIDQQRVSVF